MHLRRYKALLVHSDPLHHSNIFTFALMTTEAFSRNVGKVIIELQFDISNLLHSCKSQLQSHWMDRTCYQLHHIIDLKKKTNVSAANQRSLMPRPHPAHTRRSRSGATSPNSWASSRREEWPLKSQSSVYWKREQVLQSYHSKWCYEIYYSHWQVRNSLLPITRLQYFCNPKDLDLWYQTLLFALAGWGTKLPVKRFGWVAVVVHC